MPKFNPGDEVIYDRGLLAETAVYQRHVKVEIMMSMENSCWIEWHEIVNGRNRKKSTQVSVKKFAAVFTGFDRTKPLTTLSLLYFL